jgi:hypothetical protein
MKKGGSKTGAGKAKTGKPKTGKPKAEKAKSGKPKAGSAKAAGGNEHAVLQRELQSLLSDINEEGLRFLIDQAKILRYNAEVDRINQELVEKRTRLRTDLGAEASPSTPSKAAPPPSHGVLIEEGSNRSHFIISLGNSRKFFVRDEFRALVKVCEAAANAAEGSQRLFVWLKRNRSDVLADGGIGSGRNPLLAELYRTINKSYRAKK